MINACRLFTQFSSICILLIFRYNVFVLCICRWASLTIHVLQRPMFTYKVLLCIVIPVALSVIVWHWVSHNVITEAICWKDFANEGRTICRPKCDHGEFSLPWMSKCHPWLTCSDIEMDVKVHALLGYGAVKAVSINCFIRLNKNIYQFILRLAL